MTTLDQICDNIRRSVIAAKQETVPMLEEASILLAQKRETEMRQHLLDAFCKHFLVTDEDLTTLTSSAEPVNERFFQVLSRVKQIHKDCELLLGQENQRLGLELMEQTTRNLDAGYKKLYSWTQREFRGLDLEDPHISGAIRRSLRALSERPALFQNCLDSFAEARQSTVSEGFQKALTESTMSSSRAIEFSTHDPLRYMGDMLAWLHSATVSEMEALEGLFISDADEIAQGLNTGRNADPWVHVTANDRENGIIDEKEQVFDGRAALNSLISRNMSTVTQNLNQRVIVTMRNLSDPVEIYKAYNLLSFYEDMFLKLIRAHPKSPSSAELSNNTILDTLNNLQGSAFKQFENVVLERLPSMNDETSATDLSPPSALSDTIQQFLLIAQTRGPNLDAAEFAKLYTILLVPTLNSCAETAELVADKPGARAGTGIIYKLNYMSLIRNMLLSLAGGTGMGSSKTKITAANEPLRSANSEIASCQKQLTELLQEAYMELSGLTEFSTLLEKSSSTASATSRQRYLLNHRTDAEESSEQDTESETTVSRLAYKLDDFLASALMDAQDQLAKLIEKDVARKVLAGAVSEFIESFRNVVEELEEIDEQVDRERLGRAMKGNRGDTDSEEDDKKKGDEDDGEGEVLTLRMVYPRTVEEVEALLS